MLTKEFIRKLEALEFVGEVKLPTSDYINVMDNNHHIITTIYSNTEADFDTLYQGFKDLKLNEKKALLDLLVEYTTTTVEEREVRLSEAERVILANINDKYKWIGRNGTYTPEKTSLYERYVQLTIMKAKVKPIEGPIKVTIDIYKEVPKSFSKVKRLAALSHDILPAVRPDIDNYVKSVLDASNGMLYKDDNQVIELHARKLYAEVARVELRIEEM